MDGTESKKIAQAWVDFQKNWWAWDKLDEICRKDPAAAWAVLVELVELAQTKELLEDIGVGPLEDFINYYADEYIDTIESAVATSEALSTALSFSQLRDGNHPMAAKLEKLGCKVSAAANQADAFDAPE